MQEPLIEVVLYSCNNGFEEFYFSECTTLQMLACFDEERHLSVNIKDFYSEDFSTGKMVPIDLIHELNTVGAFINFFKNNSEYYIHNCDMTIDNIQLGSHDDGEVTLKFPLNDNYGKKVLNLFLLKVGLDSKFLQKMLLFEGNYLKIDSKGNILGVYETFDEYIKQGN